MYPKLWEITGVPYQALVDELIRLAMDDYEKRSRLKVSVEI
jgi:D-alanine-D-alanine ligase